MSKVSFSKCLRSLYYVAANGMDEDFAITLVAEFMKGLHVARLNAIRFMEAVDAAAAEMDEGQSL